MALRDQPYLPLYIQDIMTDEKLNECSAATHGVFIKGIMCLMHKSDEYGKILLKQKHKQTSNICLDFATMLATHLPYDVATILAALTELIEEKVCHFDGDYLVQKRMVNDNEISIKRSQSGKKGGDTTKNKSSFFAQANHQANTEYEYVSENKRINGNGAWANEKKLFLNNEQWQYKQATEYKIGKEPLLKYINTFLSRIELQEDYKSEKDLKRHCANWLRKNVSSEKTAALEENRILPENYWTD